MSTRSKSIKSAWKNQFCPRRQELMAARSDRYAAALDIDHIERALMNPHLKEGEKTELKKELKLALERLNKASKEVDRLKAVNKPSIPLKQFAAKHHPDGKSWRAAKRAQG